MTLIQALVQCRWMDGTDTCLQEKCSFVGDIRRQICDMKTCLWHDVVLLDANGRLLSHDGETLTPNDGDEGSGKPVCVSVVISRATQESNLAWRECMIAHARFNDVPGLRRLRDAIQSFEPASEASVSPDVEIRELFYEALISVLDDNAACDALCRSELAPVDTTGSGIGHNGRTALEMACDRGLLQTVETLLRHGAKVETMHADKNACLHWASISGYADVVKTLLAHGASLYSENNYGNAPLHWAARSGHADVCQLLLDSESIHGGCGHVDLPDYASLTPLHWAAWEGHVDVVRTLVCYGATVNLINRYGNTALHWACRVGRIDVVRVLLDAKASPVIQNKDGRTCLHDAVFNDYPEVVKLLMQGGANPQLETNAGKTALAASRGFGDEIALIMRAYPQK